MRIFLYLVSISILNSCASSKVGVGDMEGVYKKKGEDNFQLVLTKNTFVYKDVRVVQHMPIYKCCDTITYGSFETDNRGFLKLSSDESLPFFYTRGKFTEKEGRSPDSLYIFISNPILAHYIKYGELGRELTYTISINSTKFQNFYREFNANPIVIPVSASGAPVDIEVYAQPKIDIPLRNISVRILSTSIYKIKKQGANIFEIDIPALSYGNLSYLRLKKDFVKIIDQNTLEWDGNLYIRD